jgi:exosome complex exonuclease RRP6
MTYKDHTFRSYLGFICWFIIHSADTLYIIDAIKLRSKLVDLSYIISDPKVLKVVTTGFDTTALQRDFGLYAVNIMGIHGLT